MWMAGAVALGLVIWFAGARFVLRNAELSAHMTPRTCRANGFLSGPALNDEHRAVIASLGGITTVIRNTPRRQHLRVLRTYIDNFSADRVFDAQFIPAMQAAYRPSG